MSQRLSAATLRAVAAHPAAEIRGERVEVDQRPVSVAVPHLALSSGHRGVIDGLALRVRHSDRGLHLALAPTAPLERIIFDIAEQFRCESLVDPTLIGVRANTAAAFEDWSEAARGDRIGETGVGLLIYTITHMLRFRLLHIPTSEAVDDMIETTRGNLARLVGHAITELPALTGDQAGFARPAAEIARLIAEMATDASPTSVDELPDAVARNRLLVPADWETVDAELAASDRDGTDVDLGGSDYHVYSRAHDIELAGTALYRPEVRRQLRHRLDAAIAAQAVSVPRLAQRLQRLFPSWRADGWSGAEIDGPLDPGRLAQVIAAPMDPHVRRQPRTRPTSDTVVTFLVDTSGSMKVQRFETVAVLVDTLARALELAGANCEVLGFTTAAWNGGQARKDWLAAGSPTDPGRLTDLQHIVYKSADRTWKQERHSMATMLRTDHYRESVDGEAIAWAWHRIRSRPEPRRVLVLISDGQPTEASTANANRDGFLADHLRAVCRAIEGERGVAVELGAICLEHDLDGAVARSVVADLDQQLTIGSYDVLVDLFG